MARRNSLSSKTSTKRRTRSNSLFIWIVGGLVSIALVSILLFSRNDQKERSLATKSAQAPTSRSTVGPRTVKMRPGEGGVYYIPARINGQELEFIFDTGAYSVCISRLEARLLYKQGKLAQEDILGEVQSVIADGSIVNDTAVVLRSVEVAGVVLHDVEAVVSDNLEAPLLLGQSVMSKFGSFTMDYNSNTVTFR